MFRVDPGDIYDGVGFASTFIDDTFLGTMKYHTWADLIPEDIKDGVPL
ncbi:MAG: hypothetical protein Q9N34_08960 [Aquificota bacterium]|nr:hypothetical protein [Aquificota bacterium]